MWARKSLALGAAALAMMALAGAGCRRTVGEGDAEVIRSAAQFQDTLKIVEQETSKPLEAVELGESLGGESLSIISANIPRARGLVAFEPTAFGPRLLLAKLLRAANKPDEALIHYQRAAASAPLTGSPEQAAALAACYADMGGIHFGRRELKKAEDSLREALRLAPSSVVYRINLVQTLLEARQVEEARRILAQAEKLSPQSQGVKAMKKLLEGAGSTSSPPKSEGKPGASS